MIFQDLNGLIVRPNNKNFDPKLASFWKFE